MRVESSWFTAFCETIKMIKSAIAGVTGKHAAKPELAHGMTNKVLAKTTTKRNHQNGCKL
jgi:hypothetical protein